MADISVKDRTSMDIFRHVLDAGPLTLYLASRQTEFPLGTIHRHLKELEKSGKLKVYEQNAGGRKKKMYGPTFYGIVYFARLDRSILQKIENYFLLWAGNPGFAGVLQQEGFDTVGVKRDPKGSKHLFRKYVEYGIAVEDQIDMLKNNPQSISHDMFVFIGEALLISEPGFAEKWRYLYRNLPGLQKAIDSNIANLARMQRQLKK